MTIEQKAMVVGKQTETTMKNGTMNMSLLTVAIKNGIGSCPRRARQQSFEYKVKAVRCPNHQFEDGINPLERLQHFEAEWVGRDMEHGMRECSLQSCHQWSRGEMIWRVISRSMAT